MAKEIKPLYQEAFAQEFKLAPQIQGQRERIHMSLYKSDERLARQEIDSQKVYQQPNQTLQVDMNWIKDFSDNYIALAKEKAAKELALEEKLKQELAEKRQLYQEKKSTLSLKELSQEKSEEKSKGFKIGR